MPRNPRPFPAAVALAAWLALPASPAAAQLVDLIPNLFGTEVRLAANPDPTRDHSAHFIDEQRALRATGLALNESILSQLSAFPVASSAGGFTYTFDAELGTFTRSTDSFGPSFTERAGTIGKGKWNFGFNFLQASYDSISDLDLAGGDIEFQLRHLELDPIDGHQNPFFEGDLVSVNTLLEVDTQTTVFYANYGLGESFDLSVAVPIVRVELDATARLAIDRLTTSAIPAIHQFPESVAGCTVSADRAVADCSADGSASGLGDVLLRGKYRFTDFERGGLAAAVDVRLPTGDEEDLLGSGVGQVKASLIASGGFGRIAPHANLGYAVSSGDSDVVSDVPDELSYAFGLDIAAHPRVTIAAEVVGRTLFDATQPVLGDETFAFTLQGGGTGSAQRPVVSFEQDDLQLLLGAFGVKFNPAGNLLLSATALYSLSDDGLQDDGVIAVVGAEYSF
jgi:hypothetical protein